MDARGSKPVASESAYSEMISGVDYDGLGHLDAGSDKA